MNNTISWYLATFLNKKNLIILFVFVFVFNLISALALSELNIVFHTIFGYGKGYFYLVSFLKLLILVGFPIYFICMDLEEQEQKQSIIVIRKKSKRQNFVNNQIKYALFNLLYIAVQILVVIILNKVNRNSFSNSNFLIEFEEYSQFIDGVTPNTLLIIWGVLKLLELILLQLTAYFIYIKTNSTTLSFFIVIALHLPLVFHIVNIYPIGISSLQRLILIDNASYFSSVLIAAFVLFNCCMALFCICFFKKI